MFGSVTIADHQALLGLWVPKAKARSLRRDVLLALARRVGDIRVTKTLARGLGVKRTQLRHDIDDMIADGERLVWLGGKRLAVCGDHTKIELDLTDSELQTLVVALRHTRDGAHTALQATEAAHLLHRIAASLPLAQFVDLQRLGGFDVLPMVLNDTGAPSTRARNLMAKAIQKQRKLHMVYTAADGAKTARVVWPVTLTHHDTCLVAWCELRGDFRYFRIDRMVEPLLTQQRVPERRAVLLLKWRASNPVAPDQS